MKKSFVRSARISIFVSSLFFSFLLLSPSLGIFYFVRDLYVESDGNYSILKSEKIADPWTYNATYSFSNENDGKHSIEGWNSTSDLLNPTIIDFVENHSKVIFLNQSSLKKEVFTNQSYIIEFWIYYQENISDSTFLTFISDNNTFCNFSLVYNSYYNVIQFRIFNGLFSYAIFDITPLSWNRIHLNVQDSSMVIYINDFYYDSINFYLDRLKEIIFSSSPVFIDALGFSWMGYGAGENRYPLPLESIENEFIFHPKMFFNEKLSKTVLEIVSVNASYFSQNNIFYFNFGVNKASLIDSCDIIFFDGEFSCRFEYNYPKNLIFDDRIYLKLIDFQDHKFEFEIQSIKMSFVLVI